IHACEVIASIHGNHARRLLGAGHVDRIDGGVRVWRAQEECVRRVRGNDVVRVLAVPGEEPRIFFPPNRLTDQARAHASSFGAGYEATAPETPAAFAARISAAPCWMAFTMF